MAARLAPKSLTDARKRIERVLSDLHRRHFGIPAKVHVKDYGYKHYLHLSITSPKFRGMLPTQRAFLVGGWLREGLSQRDYARIASLRPLTPAEERRHPAYRP
jgi:stress-induced morphogen